MPRSSIPPSKQIGTQHVKASQRRTLCSFTRASNRLPLLTCTFHAILSKLRPAQNNHPLLLLFYEDEMHPFSSLERRYEFVGAFITTFGGAGLLLAIEGVNDLSYMEIYALEFLAITLPTAIYRQIAFLLFAQPYLMVLRNPAYT